MNHSGGQNLVQTVATKTRRSELRLQAGRLARHSVRCWLLGAATAVLVATSLVTGFAIPARESNDLLPVLCWLFIAVIWLLTQWLHGKDRLQLGATSWAVLAMLSLHTISGLVRMSSGDPRATVNTIWQWVSYGLVFWLVRQLVRTERESRALCAVMIGVAGFSAIHGGYESFYSLPREQAIYWSGDESVKQSMHRRAGLEPLAAGTPSRFHFESRLLANEPTASYALTNSLAVFLTPWMILVLGICLRPTTAADPFPDISGKVPGKSRHREVVVTAMLATVLIGMCLILTRSRSAYIASTLGILGLLVSGRSGLGRQSFRRSVLLILVLGLGMVGVAFVARRLDATVFNESIKSLGYRLQYWRSTFAMIIENPLFGCGPGNFQQYFAQFKLPQTSETVTDPHNLLLEIWATAGTPTLLVFGWLACSSWRQFRQPRQESRGGATGDPVGTAMPIYLGAFVGGSIPVFFLSSHESFLLVVFVMVIFGVNKLHPWVQAGSLSPNVVAIALAAWMINLLTAGGIGIPGVAITGWLLLAMVLPRPEIAHGMLSRRRTGVLLAGSVLLTGTFHVTGLLPLYQSAAQLAAGAAAIQESEKLLLDERPEAAEQSWGQGRKAWLAAAESDPYTAVPWTELARLHWKRWEREERIGDYEQLRKMAGEAIRLNQRSHVLQMMIGDYYLDVAGKHEVALEEALQCYQKAQRLYPASAIIVARLAYVHDLKGDRESSLRLAKRALELDALNPHMEFKLGLRRLFEGAAMGSSDRISGRTAEEIMKELLGRGLEGGKTE
ncbi:MAG: O-antigen ligase family protein [Pirellulaceae bacterium]